MPPIKPELIGTNVTDYKDPHGTLVFIDALSQVMLNGAGFTEFMWPKPGEQ